MGAGQGCTSRIKRAGGKRTEICYVVVNVTGIVPRDDDDAHPRASTLGTRPAIWGALKEMSSVRSLRGDRQSRQSRQRPAIRVSRGVGPRGAARSTTRGLTGGANTLHDSRGVDKRG